MKFASRTRNAALAVEPLESRCLLTAGILEIELVSTGNPGDPAAQVGNDHSTRQAISGDGRYVAFVSEATNLTPGDLNGVKDVFMKDMHTGVLTLVSTAADGTQGNFASSSYRPSLSADGRYVTVQPVQ
ncbi:MAG TPA: hypothetical protein VMP01_10620 [Pirellulaceae bacterium]|nr:hypothetical protein [Pirellulaceae bacterium]